MITKKEQRRRGAALTVVVADVSKQDILEAAIGEATLGCGKAAEASLMEKAKVESNKLKTEEVL